MQHKPEPFALDVSDLTRYLKIVDGMMSELQVVHVNDIPGRFVALLAECAEKMKRP